MILNLSKGDPVSVNEGINSSDYPAIMSSTLEFVRVLNRSGKGALLTKVDWASAYKQIRVNHSDIWQQGFKWLGMTFYELCLVFGASSSAGLFDRLAKIVLHIVLARSGMPRRCVIQHLDDVCSASPGSSDRAAIFYNTFKSTCRDLGVKLAPEGDRDKEFGPSTQGVVLGIVYDTLTWTGTIKEDKLSTILNKIHDCMENVSMTLRDVKSLCGKLIDIRCHNLAGPLLAITSAPNHVRNKQVVAFIDNIGSVHWWAKGWTNGCNLGNSVIGALHLVTKALNVELFIQHVPRCSCREALVADAISKSNFYYLQNTNERF